MTRVRDALLDGYDSAEGEPPTGHRREAALFVDRLLGRRWTSEAEIRSHASSAGVVLGRASALLLVVPTDKQSHQALRHASGQVAGMVAPAVEGAVRWSPLLYVAVLVGDAEEPAWTTARRALHRLCADAQVSIACIGPHRSLTDLADGFGRIEAKLHLVPGARRTPTVIDGRELEVLHLLTGQATLAEQIAFVKQVLGPVLQDDRAEEFLSVLDALSTTSGSAADVATALHMNKSTVLRRFRAIEQLTGRSLTSVCERYELLTAVRLQLLLARELQSVDREYVTGE